MSKTHIVKNTTRLGVLYIRIALNNPQWTTGLNDYVLGCDFLRELPKVDVPKDPFPSDDAANAWGEVTLLPEWELSEEEYQALRRALKHAFTAKALPINPHSVALITTFNLSAN